MTWLHADLNAHNGGYLIGTGIFLVVFVAAVIAQILTKEFNVPPENISTQGYGEQFLKIQTPGPERANRRVAIRRITPLLSRSGEFRAR